MGGVTAATWFTAAATAYGVYSQYQSSEAEKSAARESERLAKQNARAIEAEGQRAQELEREAIEEREGRARAMIAASGLGGETRGATMSDMERRHQESLDWMKRSTKSQVEIARQGGRVAKDQGYAGASQTLAGAVQTGVSGIQKIGEYQDWWS